MLNTDRFTVFLTSNPTAVVSSEVVHCLKNPLRPLTDFPNHVTKKHDVRVYAEPIDSGLVIPQTLPPTATQAEVANPFQFGAALMTNSFIFTCRVFWSRGGACLTMYCTVCHGVKDFATC